MIITAEHLIDPPEYLSQNPDVLERLGNTAGILSGLDYDAFILPVEHGHKTGRVDTQTHPVLGALYTEGKAYGIQVGTEQVYMWWFPSPTAANALSEKLDMEPGVDVLKFAHSPHGDIPVRDYVKHLAQGEFPQSTKKGEYNWGEFSHDRNDDHAPGVLLLPPAVTGQIIEAAQDKTNRRKAKQIRLAKEFDLSSSTYSKIAKIAWEYIDQPDSSELRVKVKQARYTTLGIYDSSIWGGSKMMTRRYYEVADLALEHMQGLKPKLEAAKAELAVA
ncbi:MAG TPA: hypothetical protein VG992_04645 [Candidatus Saccharimonadales bacterium]|nr:hypothetical protein [Candidatus Saccharimonadales bacterium]